MLEIKEYKEELVKLFSPDGFIGKVNEKQLLDVRIQICEKDLEGYYIETENGTVTKFNKDGEVDYWEDGLFEEKLELVQKFRKIQDIKEKHKVKVKVKIIEDVVETVSLYSPEQEYLGEVNDYQLIDVRCQICSNYLSGYYFKTKSNEIIYIDENGDFSDYEKEIFSTKLSCAIKRLRSLQSRIRKKE